MSLLNTLLCCWDTINPAILASALKMDRFFPQYYPLDNAVYSYCASLSCRQSLLYYTLVYWASKIRQYLRIAGLGRTNHWAPFSSQEYVFLACLCIFQWLSHLKLFLIIIFAALVVFGPWASIPLILKLQSLKMSNLISDCSNNCLWPSP